MAAFLLLITGNYILFLIFDYGKGTGSGDAGKTKVVLRDNKGGEGEVNSCGGE